MSALSLASSSCASATIPSIISLGEPVPCDGVHPPSPDSRTHTRRGGDTRRGAKHMLPAAMVPLGLRRDPAPAPGTRDDRPARGLEPRVDQRLAHREGGHRPRPMESRARDRLVGILLRHSEGRALILPPSSLPGWGRWGLNVLHCLGVPASSPTVERGGGDVRTDDTHAGDAVHLPTSSASADLVASRPQRFPLVRRTQSSPGPYSAKYPAANSFRVLKHQFSPRPPRRRLGSDSTQSSDGSANPPVILGTNPTEWPVMRPEPLLRIGGCVTWRARESYPFGSFQGVGNSEITLQYTPWGAQQRLLLWDHVFKLRRQLVARYGEWFRYKRGYFSAGPARLSFQYGSVWQEGPLKPPHNVPVHHCVQLTNPKPDSTTYTVVAKEPRVTGEASEMRQNLAVQHRASSSSSQRALMDGLTANDRNLSRVMSRESKRWVHHYMWEQNGSWFSCTSLQELEVWGPTCVTEWIEGWQPNSLLQS